MGQEIFPIFPQGPGMCGTSRGHIDFSHVRLSIILLPDFPVPTLSVPDSPALSASWQSSQHSLFDQHFSLHFPDSSLTVSDRLPGYTLLGQTWTQQHHCLHRFGVKELTMCSSISNNQLWRLLHMPDELQKPNGNAFAPLSAQLR